MKTISKLSLLAIALTLASCNEKVSPELQSGNSTTDPTDGPTIVPKEYYIKINNTSPILSNYKVHKTGSGNKNVNCEVKSNSALSNDFYRGNPAANDITCYFEAEELSLHTTGMQFEMEASPNTCDFLGYSPYSYYNRPAGDSTGRYIQINCMNDATNNTHVTRAASSAGITGEVTLGAGPLEAGCGAWVSRSPLLDGRKNSFSVQEDKDLCLYNYKTEGKEQCDIGRITVNEFQVTFDTTGAEKYADTRGKNVGEIARAAQMALSQADDSSPATEEEKATNLLEAQAAYDAAYNTEYAIAYAAYQPTYKWVTRNVECGGKAYNCIKGAIKLEEDLEESTSGTMIYTPEYDKKFVQKYDFPKLIGKAQTNLSYANFRRDLANPNIEYGSSVHILPEDFTDVLYKGAFADPLFGKTFDPRLIERYAKNKNMDGSTNVALTFDGNLPLSLWETYSTVGDAYFSKPLTAEPFVGLGNYTTSPFYTFYCLDTAYDIKARIRMVVRDWDRVFPTNSDLELISDIHKGANARQDVPFILEDPADVIAHPFNDFPDWDDLLEMDREDFGVLIYRPTPTAGYPDGWFNPARYPQEEFKE